MKTYSETINGIKYFASAEKALKEQVYALFELVGRIPRGNLRDGFRVEMGFSVFTFSQRRGGYQILAPDYDGDPFRETTEDLTRALLIMLSQINILKRYRVDGAPCRFDDKLILTKGALDRPLISLERSGAAFEGDSGWFLQGLRRAEDGSLTPVAPVGFEAAEELPAEAYGSMYAWQLLDKRPAAAELLLLPRGYFAALDGDEVLEILNDKDERLLGG